MDSEMGFLVHVSVAADGRNRIHEIAHALSAPVLAVQMLDPVQELGFPIAAAKNPA